MQRRLVLLGFGALGLAGALFLVFFSVVPYWYACLDDAVDDSRSLASNHAGGIEAFKNPPDVKSFEVYFFNITNVDAILEGAQPVVEEVGPYVYTRQVRRFNLSWSDGSRILSYFTEDRFEVAEGGSSDNDTIVTINLAFQELVAQAKLAGPAVYASLNRLKPSIQQKDLLFVARPARDLTFGYEDPLLLEIKAIAKLDYVDAWVPGLSGRNATEISDAALRVRTSRGRPSLASELVEWRGMDRVECCQLLPCPPNILTYVWDDHDGVVDGTDGTRFRRYLQTGDKVKVFVEPLYRAQEFVNVKGEYINHEGVRLLNFSMSAPSSRTSPSSLMEVGACWRGAAVALSKAHFLDSDERIARDVQGMSPPTRSVHDTFVAVEPITGLTMLSHRRLQVNTRVASFDVAGTAWFPALAHPRWVPLAWFDEGTGASTYQFRYAVQRPMLVLHYAQWGLCVAALLFAMAGAACLTHATMYRLSHRYKHHFKQSRVKQQHHHQHHHHRHKPTGDHQQSAAEKHHGVSNADALTQPLMPEAPEEERPVEAAV
eukprot:jgi/Chlat1/3748/Chrsp259S03895